MNTLNRSPLKAIRQKCLECLGDSPKEVRLCQIFNCPLWFLRMGKRPSTVRKKQPDLIEPEKIRAMAMETSHDETRLAEEINSVKNTCP